MIFYINTHNSTIGLLQSTTMEDILVHPFFVLKMKPCQARIRALNGITTCCSARTHIQVVLDPDLDPDAKLAICPHHKKLRDEKKPDWLGFFDD